jgi:RNA polymerase sigma-70 factor (ECF subfamily)
MVSTRVQLTVTPTCILLILPPIYDAMSESESIEHDPYEGIPDTELVKRAQADDLDAYQELMKRYQPRIYSLIYNMTSNKEDTEDLIQEVFVKAHSALPKFKGKSSFYTWVYRIAVNRSINFVKKRKRRAALSLNDVDTGVERDEVYVELSRKSTPFRDARMTEIQEKLNKALQRLSEKHRTVVVMHDIEGIPHDKIAEIIGVSSGTVRSRLFYARKQLQAELSEFIHEM